ncbi:MAG: acyl-CoA dehydrogenase family protein [Candidatus Aminicenantes bacterium]|jgi:alkylation response protein AidB-like acyl-CoA dehydrogenase
MDFTLDKEQIQLQEAIVKFARKELNIGIEDRDKNKNFFYEGWKKCSQFGLFRLFTPEEYGGLDIDPLTLMIAMEALGYACRDNGLVFAVNNHIFSCTVPIIKFGNASQKKKYLTQLASGKFIGAHAMTEADSGSDSFAMKTTAVLSGDKYILNGSKIFITNGSLADVLIVFAKTSQDKELKNVSAFIVEKGFTGFSVGKNMDKMGLRTAPMSEIVFDQCEVPKENLLSGVGTGFIIFNTAVEWERSYIFASHLGAMKRQLEECINHVKERKQFNRPIGNFQAISNRIADMKMNIELARLMLYKIGWLKKTKKSSFLESSIAKLFISEKYVQSNLDAVQMHGAFGYMTESGIERELRDSVASTIYAGTSEMQRNIISRWSGLEPY